MFVKMNKSIILAVLLLFILIPISFAADNGTEILSGQSDNSTDVISLPLDENTLKASNDYYFDASVENDGDGSINNPYKYLTADRIKANSNIYLANGLYQLDTSKSIGEVNIYGSDVDKTIIKYDGVAFTVSNRLTLNNVTLSGLSINNHAKLNAFNSIFEEGYGSRPDSYGNNFGGAIYTPEGYSNAYVDVDNCTFKDNYAVYGGAIYIGLGSLDIKNSLFLNNIAYNYGGAIACEYSGNINIFKSRFYNSSSMDDAGGSIYIRQASGFIADTVDIINSSSTFGGAITTLNTPTTLKYVTMINNSAKYDGGAIFHMYGSFSSIYGTFNNNSAINGGAVFIDNSTDALFTYNSFTNNKASNAGGAIYSLLNKFSAPVPGKNTFNSNTALRGNDFYDMSKLELIIGDGNYTMYNTDVTPISSIPAKYSLIDEGYITPVKDQQTSGNCWAFDALAILESCIIKAGGEKLDLSEENMKNIIALYSDYGWNVDTNEGGYGFMPWGYLASWLGPVDEMDDLFDDKSALSPILNSIMHVQNIKFLKRDSYTDNDEIKKAILNYGAVGTGMYYSNSYFNSNTNSYWCGYTISSNHAVTIVGWDDTYSKSNFYRGSNIEGDGAWIVRNSWGTSWGDEGYFYVSYYDRNFAMPGVEDISYTIILNDTIKFDRNYQYDIGGITDYFLNSSSKVWYKNNFHAVSDEYIAAVSTYFEKTCNWTASVLVNGILKDVISGKTNAGYYTFNLNQLIPVKKGDIFEVIFNITTDGEASFPISEIIRFNKLVYAPEISYVSYDGENWSDLYDLKWDYPNHTYNSQVAAIKAFTILNPINTVTDLIIDFNQDDLSNITAIIVDEYGNLVKYGNVTFDINGKNQTVNVINGKASILYDFIERVNLICANFNAEGYNASSNITYYTTPKIKINWNLNITQKFNNVNITVTADRLLNENIIMDINGEILPFELINGTNTLILKDLPNNNYNVSVSLFDNSDFEADNLSYEFVIDLLKTKIVSDNITTNDDELRYYNITLLDEHDNPVAGKEIIFTLNNTDYFNVTDENGRAKIFLNLNKGSYDIDTAFVGDNNYFDSYASNTIKIKEKIFINLDISTYKRNAFINIYSSKPINELFGVVVNNKSYNVTSKDGFASLKLYDLANDVYNVSVSLDESEYEFNDAESQFIINVDDPVVIETDIAIVGDDVVINILIENVTGNVIVIVDGNNDSVKLIDGKANYTIKNIASGNHSLVVIYDGGSLGENFKSEVFNVAKKESSIALIVNNAKIGEKTSIVAEVSQNAAGLVSVDINGTSYLINLSETNQLDLIFDNPGKYSVVANYLGDDKFDSSRSGEYELVIQDKSRLNVSVDVSDNIKVGENVEFSILGDITDDLKVYIDGEIQNITINKINYNAQKAGLHTIEIFAAENSNYYELNETVPFEVIKNDAYIFIDIAKTVFVGQNITINPVTDSDGQLTVKVNGEVIDSVYVVPFNGTFVVTAESDETDMYYKAFNSTTFTSIKQSSMTDMSVVAGKTGEKSLIIVNVTENAAGIVIVNINGTDYSIDLSKTNTLEVTLPKAGSYTVVATYLGDDKYEKSQSDAKIIVVNDKLPADITVSLPEDIKVGDEILINITCESDADLTVTVNGEIQNIISNGSKAQVKYRPLKDGIYNITVTSMENENYSCEILTKVFEATRKDAELEILPITAEIGDSITVHVINKTDGALTIKINDEIVIGEYNITKAGSYFVTVESAQTDEYNKGVATYYFNVPEDIKPPKMEVIPEIYISDDVKEGNPGIISVNVVNASGNVTFIIDAVETTVNLDNSGFASLTVDKLVSGNHSVVVIYYGDDTHLASHNSTGFTVPEVPVIVPIASEFSDIVISDDLSIFIVLKDENGNVISNAPIKYSINGVVGTTATDAKGSFKINGENGAVVCVNYEGNDTVRATNISLTLNNAVVPVIVKVASHFDILGGVITLNGYAVDTKADEEGIAYATSLLDENGKPISGVKIQFAVNDKVYNRTTNEVGSFTPYNLNMVRAGRYTMAFFFGGNDNYTSTFASVCVDLDKKPITIKASAKTYKASVKTKKYTVTLSTIVGSSADGKAHLRSGLTVTLNVGGKTFTGKTNDKGQVTFKINNLSKKGVYTANINYSGDLTYETASKSVKITVN